MPLYVIDGSRSWLARSDDLLFLEAFVDTDARTATVRLQTQSVEEWPLGAGLGHDPGFVGGQMPVRAGDRGTSVLTGPLPAGDLSGLLGSWHLQPLLGATLEFPTLLTLETVPPPRSRWDLHPIPRTSTAGWTAIWQGELLESGGGPRVWHVTAVSPLTEGATVLPISVLPQLADAFFQTRMAVSTLGADGWIDDRFFIQESDHPGAPTLRHAARSGRETHSTLVIPGTLSSGHRARLTTDRRREIARGTFSGLSRGGGSPSDPYVAGPTYLAAPIVETSTLTVLDTDVSITVDSPFRVLRYAGPRTLPVQADGDPAFLVRADGAPVRFALVGVDWEGKETAFTAPLVFKADSQPASAMIDAFATAPDEAKTIDLGGAPVALADRSGQANITAEAIILPVHQVVLDLATAGLPSPVLVPQKVEVALEAVHRLTDQPGRTFCDLLHRPDATGTFLTIADGGLPVHFPAPAVGGLSSPDSVLGGVSAFKGAIPTIDPRQAFAGARLLGTDLVDVLSAEIGDLPEMTSLRLPDRVETTYDWTPNLETGGEGIVRFESGSAMSLKATLTQPLDPDHPAPPTVDVVGSLTKVTVSVLDVIAVRMESLTFVTRPHSAPKVSATGVTVSFAGDLSFIQDLAEQIQDFADGCPITVDSTGVQAGYDIALPDFGFGVFSLSNVGLGAHVRVPFTDAPSSLRFAFGSKVSPFTVGVGIFGGGGYVALEATTQRLETVEASLDFGGEFAIAVVVAEGQVHALGGITLVLADTVRLEGFLRCGGVLSILDVVQLSVEFEVALGYVDEDGGSVYGRATVTVGVDVLLFHESVSFTVEKSFAVGHDLAPAELTLDPPAFDQFCEAFA